MTLVARLRVVALVVAAWVLLGVVLGSQAVLGASMQGNPVPATDAFRTAFVNWLPWIPVTLAAVAMAARFPVTRERWARRLALHVLVIPPLAWLANLLVVLGFWLTSGTFNGWGTLARQAAFWGTIRVHVAVTVYLVSATLTQGWLYYRDTQERRVRLATLEAQMAQARFRALNEQIRPHFLFNTLHTIGQLWRSGRPDEADAMLDHLGALFQKVRAHTERVFITLEEELDMVREYLAIEQARFPHRLRATVDADAAALGSAVPPLLLQPLVENAVRHGISVDPGAGRIEVSGSVHGGRLILEVVDDGPGMNGPSPHPGTGTGLVNTRARLEHAYAGRHEMHLGEGREGRGTRVRLTVPVLSVDEA